MLNLYRVAIAGLAVVASAIAADAQALQRPLTASPQTAQTNVAYSVFYTGRMYGFFTWPAVQTDKQTDCAGIVDAPSAPAEVLLKTMKKASWKTRKKHPEWLQLRVAVGDNFSPYVLAREMMVDNPPHFAPKDLYLYDDKLASPWVLTTEAPGDLKERIVAGKAPLKFDNVACFLRRAQFDAIVPGKHDFEFGPERLRELATLLATAPKGHFAPVRMLGANLSMVARDVRHTPIPDRNRRHEGYETEADVVKGAEPVLPKVALPWMRRIAIKNAFRINSVTDPTQRAATYDFDELLGDATFELEELKRLATEGPGPVTLHDTQKREYVVGRNVGAVVLCPADDVDPRKITLAPKGGFPGPGAGRCTPLTPSMPQQAGKLALTWPYHIPATPDAGPDEDMQDEYALPPNTNKAICLYAKADYTGTPYCVPFSVHQPLLEAVTGTTTPIADWHNSGGVLPFNVKCPKDGTCVAIFGVVDPSLREFIGALNYSWLNSTDDSVVNEVEVTDPIEAITQMLQFCYVSPECRGARKVLLAHMPRGKAAPLAARFKRGTFDLVISQTDSYRASGNSTIDVVAGLEGDETVDGASDSTIVVTPGPHFDGVDSDTIRVRLHQADVAIEPKRRTTERRVVTHTAIRAWPVALNQLPALSVLPQGIEAKPLFEWISQSSYGKQLIAGAGPTLRSEKIVLLERLALSTMQKFCNADAALMQHRDVFLSPDQQMRSVDRSTLRLALDAVYWKGDFITCRSVTGATLKTLLTRSREIAAAEANSVGVELESGRNLATLGLVKDGDDYLIAGQLLDPKKLYALATTDFLAEGDTGYSALQVEYPRIEGITSLGKITRLSGQIYKELSGKPPADIGDIDLAADKYLDSSAIRPLDGMMDRWYQFRATTDFFKGVVHRSIKSSTVDTRVEQRPILAVTLETASFGYTSYRHGGSESDVNSKFGGSSNTTLVKPEQSKITSDLQFRIRYSFSWGDVYNFTELHASKEKVRLNDDTGETLTESPNIIGEEFGILTNLKPGERSPSTLKVLTAARFETPLLKPFQNLKVGEVPKEVSFTVSIPREQTWSAKVGLRHEYKGGSIEGGLLAGKKYDRLTGFTFNGTKGGVPEPPLMCSTITADQTVNDCLDNKFDSKPSSNSSTDTHPQAGGFFNVRFRVPLSEKVKFVTQETGEFYANRPGDLSVDTAYSIEWTNSLELPLFGNLSVSPSVKFFFYKNKQQNTYYARTWILEAKYAFDWRSGLGLKALVFPNPSEGGK